MCSFTLVTPSTLCIAKVGAGEHLDLPSTARVSPTFHVLCALNVCSVFFFLFRQKLIHFNCIGIEGSYLRGKLPGVSIKIKQP